MAKTIKGKFVSGEKFTIGAEISSDPTKPHKKDVHVILPASVVVDYEAYSKSWPDDLPSTLAGVPITWINNIALRKKDRSNVPDSLDTDYEIQFTKQTGGVLVYFINHKLEVLTEGVDYQVFSGEVSLKLRHTDPPIGIGGR